MKAYILILFLIPSLLLFGCTGDKVLLLGDTYVDVNALHLDGNNGEIPILKDNNYFQFFYDFNYDVVTGTLYVRNISGSLDWVKLQNYPAACPAGQAIRALGDTLTCIPVGSGGGGDSNFNKFDNNSPGGVFIGLSSGTTDGSISYGGQTGYAAAHSMCYDDYNGHLCTPDEIILTIYLKGTGNFIDLTQGWIAVGPPGYTANANSCLGFTNNTNTYLGAYWIFDSTTGGVGWLTNCSQVKQLACCR